MRVIAFGEVFATNAKPVRRSGMKLTSALMPRDPPLCSITVCPFHVYTAQPSAYENVSRALMWGRVTSRKAASETTCRPSIAPPPSRKRSQRARSFALDAMAPAGASTSRLTGGATASHPPPAGRYS
jgi:hypothetical protein